MGAVIPYDVYQVEIALKNLKLFYPEMLPYYPANPIILEGIEKRCLGSPPTTPTHGCPNQPTATDGRRKRNDS